MLLKYVFPLILVERTVDWWWLPLHQAIEDGEVNTSVQASHSFFLDNKECYQSKFFVTLIINKLHFKALLQW